MQAQGDNSQQKGKCGWKYNSRSGQQQKIKFLNLTLDFKFKQIVSFNMHKSLHIIQGQLVYNNGAIVNISISHQNLLNKTLNSSFHNAKDKIVFSINSSRESLIYSAKVVGLTKQLTDVWSKECESEIMSKKNKIVHLLAGIGFQIDCQNELMKKIIFQKRQLHEQVEQLMATASVQKNNYVIQQEMVNQSEENKVIYFGPNEEINIQLDNQKTQQTQKKVEGGYFSIQSEGYKITKRGTNLMEKATLCRKTLRQKKKLQDSVQKMNQRKMKKEIEIVQSIKNKKYLIKYYCKRDLNTLEEILMEKYEYSLQEYINYFADSLEIQHKIHITQQIVEAVMLLHQSGVVHRDIKPSNFLISDDSQNPNYYQLKIIDFAESYSDSKFISEYNGDYACSHPYSPLECSELRSNSSSRSQQGIKNKEIDYWSVGMIVYQVFFRKLPLSFSRVFHLDIAASWKSELLLTVNQRQKFGLAVVEDIITILCVKMLKVQQEKRMKLQTAMDILNLLQNYVKNIMKIVEEAQ